MFVVKFTLFIVILARDAVHSKLTPISDFDETTRLSLARCIAKASETNFKQYEVITISLGPTVNETNYSDSSSLDAMLLPELFDKQKWTLLVKQPSLGRPTWYKGFNYMRFTKSNSYVLQLRAWTEIDMHLGFLKQHPSWNPHAKFIVISATPYENEEHILENIVRKMWRVDILNGVIVIPDKEKKATFNIYSWFPFANGYCGDKFNKMAAIDSCIDGAMMNRSEWFPNKVPERMNNCTVHVRTLDYPPYIVNPQRIGNTSYYRIRKGLEAQLLNMVARTCDMYMQYEIIKNDQWGDFKWPANRSTGLVGALVRGEADIAVASLSATWERHSNLDFTTAYFEDSLGFCVPHAEETSQWQKLSNLMTVGSYVGVSLTLLVVSFITTALSQRSINADERRSYSDHWSVLQKVIAILIGNSINLQPWTNQVRLFLMLWIIFSLHLDTAYQTYLMSALTSVEYVYQTQSVDDILASNLEILFRPDNKKYFQGSATTKQAEQIVARWTDCIVLDECLRRTAYKRDCAIATSRLYIQYAKSSYISKTGLPLLYCLQEQIVSFPVVAYMRHGFPLQHKVEDVISRINSAGYIQRFEADLFQEKYFAGGFKNATYAEDDFLDVDVKNKLLKLEHITPMFMMLLAGYLACVFVFAVEILVYRHWERIKRWFRKKTHI